MARKPTPSTARPLYLSEVFVDGIIGPTHNEDGSYHENFNAELFNKRANSRAFGKSQGAFKPATPDPDQPVFEQALNTKMIVTARGYIQAMFGEPEHYHQATFTGEEVKDILKTINDLTHALRCREDVVTSGRTRNIAVKPRPKTKPTIKTLTIESMRKCRVNGHTLDEFIESARVGSIDDDLELEEDKIAARGFTLTWDSLEQKEKSDNKHVSHSTLEKWWTAAK